jgi:hypothetical protein
MSQMQSLARFLVLLGQPIYRLENRVIHHASVPELDDDIVGIVFRVKRIWKRMVDAKKTVLESS